MTTESGLATADVTEAEFRQAAIAFLAANATPREASEARWGEGSNDGSSCRGAS